MEERFNRTENLIGKSGLLKLQNSRVAVFGVGGVGGYTVEALARAGIGTLDIIDNDKVCLSNINRQIIATEKTVGKFKVGAFKERILEINPNCTVNTYKTFFLPENSNEFDFSKYDYVVDAVDTVSAKIELAVKCKENNIKLISSMGTGNKLNPLDFKVADIYSTNVCPLARVMRHELKKRNIEKLKVVYSEELPIIDTKNQQTPTSISFVPSVAGLVIASEVVKDILKKEN